MTAGEAIDNRNRSVQAVYSGSCWTPACAVRDFMHCGTNAEKSNQKIISLHEVKNNQNSRDSGSQNYQ